MYWRSSYKLTTVLLCPFSGIGTITISIFTFLYFKLVLNLSMHNFVQISYNRRDTQDVIRKERKGREVKRKGISWRRSDAQSCMVRKQEGGQTLKHKWLFLRMFTQICFNVCLDLCFFSNKYPKYMCSCKYEIVFVNLSIGEMKKENM